MSEKVTEKNVLSSRPRSAVGFDDGRPRCGGTGAR